MKTALTTYDIAEHCQVTPRTVIQWINEGKLKAYRTPGNHSRVGIGEFMEFLKRYGMPVPPELAPENPARRKRILIVDDEPAMVHSIRRFLEKEKAYELEEATDGFEAGHKLSSFKPDVIVCDIRMPGLDGYKLCSHIRNYHDPHVKVILMSGYIDREELKRIKECGADDYLAKPFSNRVLKEKIEGIFAGMGNGKGRA